MPGLLVGELSGKAGHTLASKNPYANTIAIKRHSPPARSEAAQQSRAAISSIAQLFKTLTAPELAAWATLGSGTLVDGRLARQYALTAQAAFQQINRSLGVIGQPYVTAAPSPAFPAPINSIAAAAVAMPTAAFSLVLTVDPDPVPTNTYFVISAQAPRGTVASTFGLRSWKRLTVVGPGSSPSIDLATQYLAAFVRWWPGQTIPIKIQAISSAGFRGFALVAWVTST